MNKIQKFRQRTEEKYFELLRGRDRRQMLALHVYRILSNRLLITLLHRYIFPDRKAVPDRLRSICIDACLATNEHSISMDTRAELEPWSWYRGAMQQFSSSLLMMTEVSRDPFSPNAARIWKCLDYIFELPTDTTADEKIVTVFKTLQERLTVYQSFRKVKVNASMANFSQQAHDLMHPPSFDHVQKATDRPESHRHSASLQSLDTTMQPQAFAMPPLDNQDPNFTPLVSDYSSTAASPGEAGLKLMEDIDWSHFDMPAYGIDGHADMDFVGLATQQESPPAGLGDVGTSAGMAPSVFGYQPGPLL